MAEFNVLDTRKFDEFIDEKDKLIERYNKLNERFNTIVNTLLKNWKGRGAEAFSEDSQSVKMNIAGIQEILTTMCDTLIDCREVFAECDRALGESNSDAFESKN